MFCLQEHEIQFYTDQNSSLRSEAYMMEERIMRQDALLESRAKYIDLLKNHIYFNGYGQPPPPIADPEMEEEEEDAGDRFYTDPNSHQHCVVKKVEARLKRRTKYIGSLLEEFEIRGIDPPAPQSDEDDGQDTEETEDDEEDRPAEALDKVVAAVAGGAAEDAAAAVDPPAGADVAAAGGAAEVGAAAAVQPAGAEAAPAGGKGPTPLPPQTQPQDSEPRPPKRVS